MAKTYLKIMRILPVIFALVLLNSCRESTPSARVLLGNTTYGRGQYQKSILHYLSAQDTASAGLDAVHYNLANVYYALGEGEAALRSWALAEENTDDVEVLFRIAFNRGILYYNWGRYEEAYRSFRRALSLKPADIDSKINLEDALSRIRSEASQPASGEEIGDEESEEGSSRLLEYIKRKEAEGWSTQVAETETAAQDW